MLSEKQNERGKNEGREKVVNVKKGLLLVSLFLLGQVAAARSPPGRVDCTILK